MLIYSILSCVRTCMKKNSIWLRPQSHMTSHHTWGSVATLHDFGGVLGRPLDTLFWALIISWSQLLACVWSGPTQSPQKLEFQIGTWRRRNPICQHITMKSHLGSWITKRRPSHIAHKLVCTRVIHIQHQFYCKGLHKVYETKKEKTITNTTLHVVFCFIWHSMSLW
jgi:hypothetical protein